MKVYIIKTDNIRLVRKPWYRRLWRSIAGSLKRLRHRFRI